MDASPRTLLQTRVTGGGARFRTLVMGATLAAGPLAFGVASYILGVAWASAVVLAVQRALAWVYDVM